MANRIETNQGPDDVLGVITSAIDIYWDDIFDFQNTLQITSRDNDAAVPFVEKFHIQRYYKTAYYIKCVRSEVSGFGGFSLPTNSTEFKLMPILASAGKIAIRHVDADGVTIESEISLDQLESVDKHASELLSRLQLNILALLVIQCKERGIFDPLPKKVKDLLEIAYGKKIADELWQAGMK